ncbi:5'-nucleotidase [Klebsiella pneumoniae subsp. pneumoniae]|nr:5'-nucleotidase [Klebsiella pneumoniae subsp. pneumoniae]
MPYDLSSRLVIGLASSALFDLDESDEIFRTKGEDEYRKFQRENQDVPLGKGVAFPFIRRLLTLNKINKSNPPVEVILFFIEKRSRYRFAGYEFNRKP